MDAFVLAKVVVMLGALVPCGGGDLIPLSKLRMMIGREPPCDILLRYMNVSSRHCELELNEGYWFVRDLKSTNGIRVNGLLCQTKFVMPGDVLSVASHRFSLIYTPQTDRPPPEPERPMHLLEASLLDGAGPSSAATPPTAKESHAVDPPPLREGQENSQAVSTPRGSLLGELVPCGGGEPLPLLQPKLVIGRDNQCDIVLHYATVSSRHCELEMLESFWHVQDLGSRNGISVDGVKCQAKLLKPHSVLSIATHRFEIVYTASCDDLPNDEQVSFARGLQKTGLADRKK